MTRQQADCVRKARTRTVLTVAMGAALSVLVAGCSINDSNRTSTGLHRLIGSDRNPYAENFENTVEYVVVPASRAMVFAPDAVLVVERNLGGAVEQRIVLPNRTAVEGDNVIHIRAQTNDSADLAGFSFDEVATRFGGLPAPFQRATASGLNSGRDALGSYVYATERLGAGTTCVLVMRRLGVGARPLPQGTRALDIIMRNCVNGSVQQALAPMGDRAMAVGGSQTGGSINTLSPFAAPRT